MNARVRIKFCGITRVEDAQCAAALGVDAIGLVMTRASSRFLHLDQALQVRRIIPPWMAAVALFMNDDPIWIEQVVASLKPDCLQFHGGEDEEQCRRYNIPYLKAIAADKVETVDRWDRYYESAAGIVVDSHAGGVKGGSGTAFDWSKLPGSIPRPWFLAGGLNPANVAEAISQAHPYGVDVSTGIESAAGIKDAIAMRHFVDEVMRVR